MRGRWVMIASSIGFYLLASALAAALVHFSLGQPPRLFPAAPQIGTPIEAGRAFGPMALQYARAQGLEAHVPRARDGTPLGLRLAARQSWGEEIGARLELAPQSASALAGSLMRVAIDVQPLQVSNAAALAVRIEGEAPAAWSALPLEEGKSMRLVFDLPVPPGGARAIWFRPVPPQREDYAFGIQIDQVDIMMMPAGPAN